MKRIAVSACIAALGALALAAPATAEPADAACFGQVHKAVNHGALPGVDNVGDLVKALGGPGKNAVAHSLC